MQESFSLLLSYAKQEDICFNKFIFLGDLEELFHTSLPEQGIDQWQILSNHIQSTFPNGNPDQWNYVWNPNVYKSRKMYHLFFSHIHPDIPLTLIWKSKGTMKIKVFLCLLLMDRLNTKDLLQRMHFNTQVGTTCNICNLTITKDYIHLFFSCSFAQQCWNYIGINWDLLLDFMNMIMTARRLFPQPFFMEVLRIGCWHIWNRRNDQIFNNVPINLSKWKVDFKEDFTRHMDRIKVSDKPSWHSWINIIS